MHSSKAVWFYFANIITKEAWLTLINTSSFKLLCQQQWMSYTFADIVVAKFNPTITLVPYIKKGMTVKLLLLGESTI